MTTSVSVWPLLGTTVTLASGYVITAAGAVALLDDEIAALLTSYKLLTWDPTELNPNPSPIPPSGQTGGAITTVSQAALSVALGLADQALAVTQGATTANDLGGGSSLFYDAASAAAVDYGLVLPHQSGTGRIRRIRPDSEINVKWFGAIGDGASHPLTGAFANVAAAQARFPFVQKRITGNCTFTVSGGTPTIPAGLYVQDTVGCQWEVTSAVTYASGGFITVPVRAVRPGVGVRSAGTVVNLYYAVPNVGPGVVASGGLTAAESDAACLARYEMDMCGIQAALNACQTGSGGIFIPKGNYQITESIYCGWLSNNVFDINVRGENAKGWLETTCKLTWQGDSATRPLFWFSGYNYCFESFGVDVGVSKVLWSAIELGNIDGIPQVQTTSNFYHVSVRPKSLFARLINGFTISGKNPVPQNQENHAFEGCIVFDAEFAGLYIGPSQPYNTLWHRGYILHSGANPVRGYGIYAESTISTGSLRVTDSDFTHLECSIRINDTAMPVFVSGGEMEKCKKAFHATYPFLTSFQGCNHFSDFRCNNTNAEMVTEHYDATSYWMFQNEGGLDMVLDSVYADSENDKYGIYTRKGQSITARGCTFSTNAPFGIDSDGASFMSGVYTNACKQMKLVHDADGACVKYPNLNGSLIAPGTFTITGAATTAATIYGEAGQAGDFRVRFTLVSFTGTPAAGSFTPYASALDQNGFTPAVPIAPGVGNSVTFRYECWR